MGERRKGAFTQRVGLAIRNQRRAAGLSQEGLALEARIDRSFLSEIERGLKSPTVETILVIAQALGLKASELIRFAEEDSLPST